MTTDREALYKELLPLLDGPLRQKDRIWSYCPAHADGAKSNRQGSGLAGRSLSLSREFGLDCFAGCTFTAILKALRARGTGPRSQPREPQPRPTRHAGGLPANAQLIEAYEYRDPKSGALLAVKGRFEWQDLEKPKGYDKSFRWRLPEGTFDAGIKSAFPAGITEMPLWGAEELLSAPKDRRVWLAEGEKATKAIRAAGELAVCGGWGASQREFGQGLEVLRGRDVLLWPDNDQAGRDYMVAVRKAIKSVARTVTIVQAPVPPQGDAVEFFRAGGKVEELLEGVLTRPTVDVLANDHFCVRIPTDAGPVAFDFADMVKGFGALDCELTVSHLSPDAEEEPFSQRVNLLSHSARESLERALRGQFGKAINWTATISAAYARARGAYLEADRGMHVSELPEVTQKRFLVEQLLPYGHPSILFGDGGSGKSMFALALGVGVALGAGFCGLETMYGPVLYIDYETDSDAGEDARMRIRRLMQGIGADVSIMEDMPFYYWPGHGIPLADQVEGIRRFIAKHGIIFAIIDSGGTACGAEPEKASSAIGYFAALAKLGVTTLTICHVNRGDAKDGEASRPFGSAYWHNMARRTWYIARNQEGATGYSPDVGLFCKKTNADWPSPLGFKMHFRGFNGPVLIEEADANSAFDDRRPLSQRMADIMGDGSSWTVRELCEQLSVPAESVRSVLNRGQVYGREVSANGRSQRWRMVMRGIDDEQE